MIKCDLQDSIFRADYIGHTNLSVNSRPFFLCSVEKNSLRGTGGRVSNPPGERAIPFPSWQMAHLVDKNKARSIVQCDTDSLDLLVFT